MINLNDLKVEREKMLKEKEEIEKEILVKKEGIAKEILEKYFDNMLKKVFEDKEERNSLFISFMSCYSNMKNKEPFSLSNSKKEDFDIIIKTTQELMPQYTENGFTCILDIQSSDFRNWGILFKW